MRLLNTPGLASLNELVAMATAGVRYLLSLPTADFRLRVVHMFLCVNSALFCLEVLTCCIV